MYADLPDYLRTGLELVIVGINPGERSAQLGHYYARPGNLFWPLLHESGLVEERLGPHDDARLPEFGIGITDVVKRWSRSAGTLRAADFAAGIPVLRAKLERFRPRAIAFNGKTGFERFAGRTVQLGPQGETVAGAKIFVLPSTSGLNARLTREQKLGYFEELAHWLGRQTSRHL
jgi:double-stranded uracil-DNA glycosylase